MHTFIYPIKNSYITNEEGYESSNFSLDSTLEVKSVNSIVPVYTMYVTQSISGSTPCGISLLDFIGSFIGGLSGSAESVDIYISGSSYCFTDNYSGILGTGSVTNYSGSLSGSTISGSISGIFSGSVTYISGTISNFTGSVLSGSEYVGTGSVYNPTITNTIVSTTSRTLMQFDLSAISRSLANGTITNTGSLKFFLTLKNSKANELPISYSIFAYPLSQSWDIGDGRYQLGGSDNGVSWEYRDYYGGTRWNYDGGTFITSTSASQDFNYAKSDVKMDITNIANAWISGTIPNNGLILLTSLESSSATTNNSLTFFSTETNTIYSPYLDTFWDDSVYNTASLSSSVYPYSIALQNLKGEYKFGNIPKIIIHSRPQNPLKNFVKNTQLSQYLTSSYLPSSSYYAIKDNESEEIFIDFDEGSKISCDGQYNYFKFDTTGLPQERYFRILIKVIDDDGGVNIMDNKNVFKITR